RNAPIEHVMIAEKCCPILFCMVAAEKRQNSRLGIADIDADVDQAHAGEEHCNRRIGRFFPPCNNEPYKGNEHLHDRSPKDVQRLAEDSKKEVSRFMDVENNEVGEP